MINQNQVHPANEEIRKARKVKGEDVDKILIRKVTLVGCSFVAVILVGHEGLNTISQPPQDNSFISLPFIGLRFL